jgi:hypothetical protein
MSNEWHQAMGDAHSVSESSDSLIIKADEAPATPAVCVQLTLKLLQLSSKTFDAGIILYYVKFP